MQTRYRNFFKYFPVYIVYVKSYIYNLNIALFIHFQLYLRFDIIKPIKNKLIII